MNIFVTDTDPVKSAQALDDKRLIKMILETTQILSTVQNLHHVNGPYKSTHVNHPATLWANKCEENFYWLQSHGAALSICYFFRFGKKHKCENLINNMSAPITMPVALSITPFANCTANKTKGISYKHIEDTCLAYRMYLIARWNTDTRPPKWTKATMPVWAQVDSNGKYSYNTAYRTLFEEA